MIGLINEQRRVICGEAEVREKIQKQVYMWKYWCVLVWEYIGKIEGWEREMKRAHLNAFYRSIDREYRAWNYVNWTLSIAARDSFLYWYVEYDKCTRAILNPSIVSDSSGSLLDELPFFDLRTELTATSCYHILDISILELVMYTNIILSRIKNRGKH